MNCGKKNEMCRAQRVLIEILELTDKRANTVSGWILKRFSCRNSLKESLKKIAEFWKGII